LSRSDSNAAPNTRVASAPPKCCCVVSVRGPRLIFGGPDCLTWPLRLSNSSFRLLTSTSSTSPAGSSDLIRCRSISSEAFTSTVGASPSCDGDAADSRVRGRLAVAVNVRVRFLGPAWTWRWTDARGAQAVIEAEIRAAFDIFERQLGEFQAVVGPKNDGLADKSDELSIRCRRAMQPGDSP